MRSSAGTRLADVAAGLVSWEDGSQSTVVAVVGHRRLEILTLDETGFPVVLGGLDTEWEPFRVAVALDPLARLVLVRDNAGKLAVFALGGRPGPPKLLYTLQVPGSSGPLLVVPELGLAFSGTTPVQYRPPVVRVVADADGDGKLEPVRYLQPLGAPAPAGQKVAHLGWVVAEVPGVPEGVDTVEVEVAGLGPGGAPLALRPDPLLPSSARLLLHRASAELADPGRHVFVSTSPLLLVADERARSGYWDRLSREERRVLEEGGAEALCRHCGRDLDGDGVQDLPWGVAASREGVSQAPQGKPIELAAAARVRVALVLPAQGGGSSAWLAKLREAGVEVATEVASVEWMPSPAVGSHPGVGVPAPGAEEVELASGTVGLFREDLHLAAPGLDVGVGRRYFSGGICASAALGWGWSLAVPRLRPNPHGTVDLWEGCERYAYRQDGPGASRGLTAWGRPEELVGRQGGGYILKAGDGSYWEFDGQGYPVRYRDRYRRGKDQGSELNFRWGADGSLVLVGQYAASCPQPQEGGVVCAAAPRWVRLEYEEGKLAKLLDSTGRQVELSYEAGLLTQVKLPEVELDAAGSRGRPGEQYSYASVPSDDLKARLEQAARLATVVDATGRQVGFAYNEKRVRQVQRGELVVTVEGEDPAPSGGFWTVKQGSLSTQLTLAWGENPKVTVKRGQLAEEQFELDRDGRLRKHTDGAGITTEVTYQAEPRRASFAPVQVVVKPGTLGEPRQEAPRELVTSYAYLPGTDLVTRITRPGPAGPLVTTIQRSETQLVTTAPDGTVTTELLDPLGRPTERQASTGQVVKFSYEDHIHGSGEVASVETVVADQAVASTIQRDSWGNPVRSATPGAGGVREVVSRYNALGWVLRSETGSSVTSTAYDAAGRVVELASGVGTEAVRTTASYTGAGLLASISRQGGGVGDVITFSYDAAGQVVQTAQQDQGQICRTRYAYDAAGLLASRIEEGGGQELLTSYQYDAAGRVVHITSPGGLGTSSVYDTLGRQVGQQQWATDGSPLAQENLTLLPDGSVGVRQVLVGGEVWQQEQLTYDPQGRVASRSRWVVPLPPGGAQGSWATWSYRYYDQGAQRGLLAEVVDPLGAKVRFAYDEAGREVMRELADGSKLLRRYAASGELLESRWELPGGKVLVSQYSYDAQGRVVSIQEPGRWVRRSYDSQGRVIAELVSDSELGEDGRERPVERLWRWEYDPLGRQVKQIRPDGGVITRTFDTRGNLLVYEDPQGHRTSSSYDCFGKLRRSILREDSEGSLWVFGYDGLGRLASKQGVAAVRQEDPLLGAVRRLEHWSISQTDELLLRQRQLDSRQEVLFASTNALHQVTKLAITTLQGCVFLEAGRTFLSAPGSAAGVPSA